jgi:hypothetical protein
MPSRTRILRLIGVPFAAIVIGGLAMPAGPAVAAPAAPSSSVVAAGSAAVAAAPDSRRDHALKIAKRIDKASPALARTSASALVAGPCPSAGVQLDPFAILFEGCVFPTATDVTPRCSDGFVFTTRRLPAGTYDILVDCFPARFSSIQFVPVG